MNLNVNVNLGWVVIIVIIIWVSYRLYKKYIMRGGARRFSKILLRKGEKAAWRSPITGKLRWAIKNPVKLTFMDCGMGLELKKIDFDPITVWHVFYARWMYPDQENLNGLHFVKAAGSMLEQLQRVLQEYELTKAQPGDVSLRSLFEDFLD